MPQTRVAVVGAGAIGLAVSVQLARAGITDVVVIDRNAAAGQGSTGRANGGVRVQFSAPLNIELSRYTIQQLADLDRASGGLVAYRPYGYLFLAGSEDAAKRLQAAVRTQRSVGVAVEELSPQKVAAMVPCLRLDGLRCAAFCATDGLIDPHGVAAALHGEGRDLGCMYRFGTEVRGIEPSRRGVVLRCSGGDVEAEVVVNAAGAQAADVAALAGVELPVQPHRRNLACTEPLPMLPERMPMCVDSDSGVLVRREADGALVGYSPTDAPTRDESFDPAFLDDVAERVGNRFPFLVDAAINPQKCWAGLYPETPDHHAIIDAPGNAPWFIQCAGFGGHGIMHCMAAGQVVTELIRDQRCSTFDISPLRLNRFDGSTVTETSVL